VIATAVLLSGPHQAGSVAAPLGRGAFLPLVLAWALLLALAAPASAAPVLGEVFELRQPDGSSVPVRVWGDEFYQVVESLDGFTLVRDPLTEEICYARLSADGNQLVSTGVSAGLRAAWSDLPRHLRVHSAAARAQARAARAALAEKHRLVLDQLVQYRRQTGIRAARPALSRPPAPGAAADPLQNPADSGLAPAGELDFIQSGPPASPYGLVLLIDFPDLPGTIDPNDVQGFCNQPSGFNLFGNNGSARQYYAEVSSGQLTYTTYITPQYYRALHPKSYYDNSTNPFPDRAKELITEALDWLDEQGHDFSVYDGDGDGDIDALNCYYAGWPSAGWSKGLWPHSSALYWYSGSGVYSYRYQISNLGNGPTLRTFCHENGHMLLGWPDLYDYGFESSGLGDFCLMAYGGSNTNPVQPCPYLKTLADWADVTSLTASAANLTLPAAINNQFYRFDHFSRANEYFLVSNAWQSGRDAGLPDAGLALWHIDANASNDNEQMTYVKHYRVTLVQADGAWHLEHKTNYGDGADLFASGGNSQVGPATNPSSAWWDGGPSGLRLYEIGAPGPTLTFSAEITPVPQTPYGGQARDLPGRIEAEDYDVSGSTDPAWFDKTLGNSGGSVYRLDDVDLQAATDASGGYQAAWIDDGEWLEYTVNLPAGVYDIALRVATSKSGKMIRLKLDGALLGTVNVPNTGGFSHWQTVSSGRVELPAGAPSVLRLEMAGGGNNLFNLNWIEFVRYEESPAPGGPYPLPGRVQAEDYDLGGQLVAYYDATAGNSGGLYRADDVDIYPAQEPNGWAVRTAATEWLAYSVVAAEGLYDLDLHFAGPEPNAALLLLLDGAPWGAVSLPPADPNWRRLTVRDLWLAGGPHVLRVEIPSAGFDLDWLDFLYADPCRQARARSGYVPFAGDLNADCRVDLLDLDAFMRQWLTLYNLEDFADLAANWLDDNSLP